MLNALVGWLFLFAVLYSAALLFGMVFFVRLEHQDFYDFFVLIIRFADYHVFRPRKRLH